MDMSMDIPDLCARQHLRLVFAWNDLIFLQPAINLGKEALLGLGRVGGDLGQVVGGTTQVRQRECFIEERTEILRQHSILGLSPVTKEHWVELAAILMSQPIDPEIPRIFALGRAINWGGLAARNTLGFGSAVIPDRWDGISDVPASHTKLCAEGFLAIGGDMSAARITWSQLAVLPFCRRVQTWFWGSPVRGQHLALVRVGRRRWRILRSRGIISGRLEARVGCFGGSSAVNSSMRLRFVRRGTRVRSRRRSVQTVTTQDTRCLRGVDIGFGLVILVGLSIEEMTARQIAELGKVEEKLIVLEAIGSLGMGTRDGIRAHSRHGISRSRGHPGKALSVLTELDLQPLDLGTQQTILLVCHVRCLLQHFHGILQILQVLLLAFAEGSLGSSVLGLALLLNHVSSRL